MTITHDVAIIGGSFAGLSAAVTLRRSLRSAVVIDAGQPRNAPAGHAHNVLGVEGINPGELLRRGRAEALQYGATFIHGTAITAAHDGDLFRITVRSVTTGSEDVVMARAVLLATGLVDELPHLPGVAEGWGTSMLHCPYCHGYEVRGQRIGILAVDERFAHQALLFSQLSNQVTVLPAPGFEPGPRERALAGAAGAVFSDTPVSWFSMNGAQVESAVLADGSSVGLDAVVVAPQFNARTELFQQLGGVATESPMGRMIPVDAMGQTPIPGVFAAGNVSNLGAMVYASAAAGTQAGAGINYTLAMKDAQTRVKPAQR